MLNPKLFQVVVGWNFEITYTIIQTNCSKEHFLFLTPDCKSLSSGVSRQKLKDEVLCFLFIGLTHGQDQAVCDSLSPGVLADIL